MMEENIVAVEPVDQLIVVRQLPIIEERLKEEKARIVAMTEEACQLACTVETLKTVKETRARLNKELTEYETARKKVKAEVLAPYDAFEKTYKDCISEPFKTADAKLKAMIDSVEYYLRDEKEREIRRFYGEHLVAAGLDPALYVFERSGIRVLLSASDKRLKEEAKAFVDRIKQETDAINQMDDADAIMAEYKRSLNMAQAIQTVKDRRAAEAEAKLRREQRETYARVKAEAEAKIQEAMPVEAPRPVEVPEEPSKEEEPVLQLTFKVRGTRTQLKALKQFLIDGGYQYE